MTSQRDLNVYADALLLLDILERHKITVPDDLGRIFIYSI